MQSYCSLTGNRVCPIGGCSFFFLFFFLRFCGFVQKKGGFKCFGFQIFVRFARLLVRSLLPLRRCFQIQVVGFSVFAPAAVAFFLSVRVQVCGQFAAVAWSALCFLRGSNFFKAVSNVRFFRQSLSCSGFSFLVCRGVCPAAACPRVKGCNGLLSNRFGFFRAGCSSFFFPSPGCFSGAISTAIRAPCAHNSNGVSLLHSVCFSGRPGVCSFGFMACGFSGCGLLHSLFCFSARCRSIGSPLLSRRGVLAPGLSIRPVLVATNHSIHSTFFGVLICFYLPSFQHFRALVF